MNYSYFKENYPSLNISFLPPTYHYSLETYFSSYDENIPYENKDIDIFIFASRNARRNHIFNQLIPKYKVFILDGDFENTGEKICRYMCRSKIVLNVMFYNYNLIHCYFRLSFLFANNAFVVTEKPNYIDLEIQPELKDMDKYVLMPDYDNIVSTIDEYLTNKSNEEINERLIMQKKWFENNIMNERLDSFFLNLMN